MYSLGTTLLKALVEYLKHAGFITAAQVSAIQIPQTASDWSNTNTLVSLALPLLPALWRALENYRKNGRGPGQDAVWQWPWSRS